MRKCYLTLVTSVNSTIENEKEEMSYQDEDRKKRSIELPVKIWDYIEEDAKRTRRSANGVVEAILMRLYLGTDIELHGVDELKSQQITYQRKSA